MNDTGLLGYLAPLRRWWWIVVVAVILALGAAALTMPGGLGGDDRPAEASSYEGTHLLIRNGEAPSQLTFELITLLSQQGDLVNRVADRLGGEVSMSEVQAVELVSDPLTETISVTAVRPTPEQTAAVASTYADELVKFLDERTLNTIENDLQRVTERRADVEQSVDEVQAELATLGLEDPDRPLLEAEQASLLEEFSQLRSQERSLSAQREGLAASFVTLEAPSPIPADGDDELLALPQRPLLRASIAAVLALVLSVGLVLLIDHLDKRVRTRREAEEAFGLPVLAELPKRSRRHMQAHKLPTFQDPGSATAEVVRALRLSIALAPTWHLTSLTRDDSGAVGGKTPVRLEHQPRSIVITSAMTGEGKSTLAANLAVSIAEGGGRVLVVDCDFRRPAVGELLEVDAGVGLRELTRVDERPMYDLAAPTVAPNVAMVRSGSRGVTPSWFMGGVGELVRRCLEMADVVIFDTGPITLTNEASALLPHVDTGLLVVRAGRVGPDQARAAVEQLTQVDARVSGLVLVGPDASRRYGYGYYDQTAEDDTEAIGSSGAVGGEDDPSPWGSNRPQDPDTAAEPRGEDDAPLAGPPGHRRSGPSGHAPM
jgi:capsular exopolysaccharide synthesis family protein